MLTESSPDADFIGLLLPEEAIAEGVELARRDATVARVLPVAIYRSRNDVDFGRLYREARRRTDPQAGE